jgi:hypothetical protein
MWRGTGPGEHAIPNHLAGSGRQPDDAELTSPLHSCSRLDLGYEAM